MSAKEQIIKMFEEVKEKTPLVHNITNYVTVNDCANILLCVGGSPIMADDINEVGDIVRISNALVINIGTLNERTIKSMIKAGGVANSKGVPVVLDPVGAGASGLRNSATMQILGKIQPSVIRGNISELAFIAGESANTRGVDASELDEKMQKEEIAKAVAKKYKCVVCITGAKDVVTDGEKIITLDNGVAMLSKVTGTGCMTSAMIGAFAGLKQDMMIAAACGVSAMSIAGELSLEKNKELGLGSFKMGIFDGVSSLSSETLSKRLKVGE